MMGSPFFKNKWGTESVFSWVGGFELSTTNKKTTPHTEVIEGLEPKKLLQNIIDRFANLNAGTGPRKSLESFRLFSLIKTGPFSPKTLNRFLAPQSALKSGETICPIRLTQSLPAFHLFAGERGELKKSIRDDSVSFSKMGLFENERFIPEHLLPRYEIDFVETSSDAFSFLQSPLTASEIWVLVAKGDTPDQRILLEHFQNISGNEPKTRVFELTL
jgi:hypothetical protein